MPDATPDATPAAATESLGELASKLAGDLATLDVELAEIDLLVTQAKTEAARHEARRNSAATKLSDLGPDGELQERLDLTTSLVTLSKRAALMDSQVDVLEGKRRVLSRYRDAMAAYSEAAAAVEAAGGGGKAALDLEHLDPEAPMPPAVSRMLLGTQEDLRREIARAMHDGPAQSLTNIVLQAQIVERLVLKDPQMAAGEVRQLVAMVEQTLEATKTFIFDVRPMVLDDLGLVPTLRRSARDRGRRANIPVEFESMGQDRRLSMDLESALFRMLDEALAAYLAADPEQVAMRLDWGDQLEARISATRSIAEVQRGPGSVVPVPEVGVELPPALAAMMEDRRTDEREAVEAAARDAIVALPATTWREIRSRAGSVGVTADLLADGGEVRLVADIPPLGAAGA